MIRKILHLADIHIRTYQYHDVYEEIFNKFIIDAEQQLKGVPYEEIRVVIAGDIAHQKINISNEQLLLTANFIAKIADNIGKVIIIPGNHDFLENNTDRLDSITPVVELLNNKNISYYKDSGVYDDENVNWIVYSLYQHNERPKFEKIDNKLNFGLFHGPIEGMTTDLGFKFEDGYDRLNFVGLDALFCGDIHKRQQFMLNGGGKAVMVGSLIQQNFGETVKNHGYGIYNVSTDEYIFRDIHNDNAFLHFKINDINDIEDEKEILVNLG